ncbi:MAG: hypothetical protein LBR32_08080 [Propionibacteriaceae bacterium]|nr:hypothetical protein [Propionibacteriaceae bacterium]
MFVALVVMVAALALSLIVVAVAAVAVRSDRNSSGVVAKMAAASRHLNGEAAPPAKVVTFFEELPIPHSAASAADKHDLM